MRYRLALLFAALFLPSAAAATLPGTMGRLPVEQAFAPQRSGTYYISRSKPAEGRCLIVALHGFRGSGDYMVDWFRPVAEEMGLAIVGPDSARDAWQLGKAAAPSADAGHIARSLLWLERHAGPDRGRKIVVVGHSYGTRMAAYVGTTFKPYDRVGLMHGRFVPASLGPKNIPAFFSGSPKDNQFAFEVTLQQWDDWPGHESSLHTYDCPTCQHSAHPAEIRDFARWACAR